jgi:acylphosphatase
MNKIKGIIIEGERVHYVGYRPFLLAKARRLGIPNYEADNVEVGGKQRVIVSVGGEEKQVLEFVGFAEENYPRRAEVGRVCDDPNPPERVMPIDEYQKVLDSEQHNTMVQAGLKMIDMQKQTVEEIKTVGVKVDNVAGKIDNFAVETK